MICIVALIVFGILGIFSAKFRPIAAEAADCVFRRLTLRKCETGLDKRLKNQISGKLAPKRPKTAKFLHKYFEVFSWIFIIIFVWSIVATVLAGVNYVKYGNCNGPENSGEFCVFDPTGAKSQYSGTKLDYTTNKKLPEAGNDPSIGPDDAKVTIIEFGCVTCPFTKEAEHLMKQLVEDYKDESVRFVFKEYPLPAHETAIPLTKALYCAESQNKYFEGRAYLFNNQGTVQIEEFIKDLNLDKEEFDSCFVSPETFEEVMKNVLEGRDAQIYGTPAIIIGDEIIIGNQKIQNYKKLIDKELAK